MCRLIIILFLGLTIKCYCQDSLSHPYCGFGKMKEFHGLNSYSSSKSINSATDVGQYFIIPVVVHVIHNGGPENLSDADIQSQIPVLNEDFGRTGRGYNSSPLGEDAKIRFALATIDPNGNPTTGIEHIKSSYTNMNSDSEMLTKNLSVWDRTRYMNIWVVKSLDQVTSAGDEIGYAYLSSDVQFLQDPNADGLVVSYKYFGRNTPYNPASYQFGRTTTHETGHYFNLLHTWGLDGPGLDGCTDGNDDVDDTPPCEYAYYSKYNGTISDTCDDPVQCDNNLRLISDYMDYSVDRCMNIFTKGQITRMRQSILTDRASLVSYENMVATGLENLYLQYNPPVVDALDITPNPCNGTFYLYPDFVQNENSELYIFDQLGRIVKHFIINLKKEKTAVEITNAASGMYNLILITPSQIYKQKLILQRD